MTPPTAVRGHWSVGVIGTSGVTGTSGVSGVSGITGALGVTGVLGFTGQEEASHTQTLQCFAGGINA